MIETLKTKNGYIYAYLEWTTMTMEGQPIDKGPRIHVYNLWVHDSKSGDQEIIKRFINKVKSKVNYKVKKITWLHGDSPRMRIFEPKSLKRRV